MFDLLDFLIFRLKKGDPNIFLISIIHFAFKRGKALPGCRTDEDRNRNFSEHLCTLGSYAKYLEILLFTDRNRKLETGGRISQVGVCKWEVKRIPVFKGNKDTARSLRQLPFCVVLHPFTVLEIVSVKKQVL